VKVILFGATGMIGSGALIECLEHPDVEAVLAVGRRPSGARHEKLSELVHDDLLDVSGVVDQVHGYDACLYCLGVSSAGMSEEAYDRVTYAMTVAAAEALLAANPRLVMCYISGAGADGSESGRVMWARIKGKTENQLKRMPFASVWIFRPGYIQPLKGVRSRTPLYNALYAVTGPVFPILARLAPRWVTTTEKVGLALIRSARDGAPSTILESADINALAEAEEGRLSGR
jgi:uncharacterized protein YbjT (DUF2867 family)